MNRKTKKYCLKLLDVSNKYNLLICNIAHNTNSRKRNENLPQTHFTPLKHSAHSHRYTREMKCC